MMINDLRIMINKIATIEIVNPDNRNKPVTIQPFLRRNAKLHGPSDQIDADTHGPRFLLFGNKTRHYVCNGGLGRLRSTVHRPDKPVAPNSPNRTVVTMTRTLQPTDQLAFRGPEQPNPVPHNPGRHEVAGGPA